MIDLKLNHTSLDLGGNANIGLELTSPLFQRNNIPGSISYPFTIPATPNNRRQLNHPELLSSTEQFKTYSDVQLYIEHILYKIGTLKIQDTSDKDYRINFKSDSGDIQEKIKDVKLADIDLGTATLDYNIINSTYPTAKYQLFPLKNPDFYGENNTEFAKYLNYYTPAGAFATNTLGNNQYAIVPFPYLRHILDRIGTHLGYTFTGTWLSEADVQRTVIYNNYALDNLNAGNNDFITAANGIDFKNHVPDITIGQFFVALQNYFGLAFIFNPILKTCQLVRLTDVANNREYIDWTSRTEPGYKNVPYEYLGFELLQSEDSQDKLFEEQDKEWLEQRVDNGGKEIATMASTLFMRTETDEINSRAWTIPEAKQPGSSPEFDQGINDFTLRFLVYRGLQPDGSANNYPLGTWDINNHAGSAITGAEKTLRWAGSNGLYQQNYKAWLDLFKNTRYVERKTRLNIEDLLNFDWTKKIQIDHVRYLPVTLRLQVNQKTGIQTANVKLFKVNL